MPGAGWSPCSKAVTTSTRSPSRSPRTCRASCRPATAAEAPKSRLRNRSIDLPGGGRHVGLEAEATDDLFERRVVALGGDRLRSHRDLGRVGDVLAVEAAQAEASLGKRMQQQR